MVNKTLLAVQAVTLCLIYWLTPPYDHRLRLALRRAGMEHTRTS